MKKPILIALCCASLMLVTPLTGVAQENKVSSNLTDKPDIDILVAQIKDVVNEILQRYGHNPMVRSLCNVILNSLGLIGNMIFCFLLFLIILPLAIYVLTVFYITGEFPSIVVFLLLLISEFDLNCHQFVPFINFNLPFNSIYSMLNVNDNINLAKDCPCLQE